MAKLEKANKVKAKEKYEKEHGKKTNIDMIPCDCEHPACSGFQYKTKKG